MYYLGTKNEDEVVSTTVKLGHPMSTKKIDKITTVAMLQESKILKELYWDIYQISLVPG